MVHTYWVYKPTVCSYRHQEYQEYKVYTRCIDVHTSAHLGIHMESGLNQKRLEPDHGRRYRESNQHYNVYANNKINEKFQSVTLIALLICVPKL